MIRTDLGGLPQDLWLPSPIEGERLPQPWRDMPPAIPGEPIEEHLSSLYPQYLAERQRLAFADPGARFQILSSPASFRQELGELVGVLNTSSAAIGRDARALVHELWVNRALCDSHYLNLLKA